MLPDEPSEDVFVGALNAGMANGTLVESDHEEEFEYNEEVDEENNNADGEYFYFAFCSVLCSDRIWSRWRVRSSHLDARRSQAGGRSEGSENGRQKAGQGSGP